MSDATDPNVNAPAKDEKPAAAQPTHSLLDTLTIKQRTFVEAIATQGSDTFGNGARSAVAAGYAKNPIDGRRKAYELRTNPDIRTAIEETLNRHKLSIEDRSGVLADILHSRHNVTEQYDGEGNLVSRTLSSNSKDRLHAVGLLNKMDGTYSRAEAVGRAQGKVLDGLLKEYGHLVRESLKDAPQPTLDALQRADTGIYVQSDDPEPHEPTEQPLSVDDGIPEHTQETAHGVGGG